MTEIAGPIYLTLYMLWFKFFLVWKFSKKFIFSVPLSQKKNWFENFKSAEKKLDYTEYAVKAWIIL